MKSSFVSLLILALFAPYLLLIVPRFYKTNYNFSSPAQMPGKEISVLHTMRARSLRLSKYCSKFPHLRTGWRNNSDVLVSRPHKLSWCKIPKSASTSVVQALLMLLGCETLVREASRSRQHTNIRRLMPPLMDGEDLPIPGNAFLLLRHPFSRILSAYRDKIATKSERQGKAQFVKFFKLYNSPIISKYRQRQPDDSFYRNVPTFPEFVEYLIDTPSYDYNEHWKPYYLLCAPCDIPYNVLLKIESLNLDNFALILITGYPELVINSTHRSAPEELMRSAPPANRDKDEYLRNSKENKLNGNLGVSAGTKKDVPGWDSMDLKKYYFSQLTQTQIRKLFDIYRVDFEMFDYEIEPFLSYGMS